MKKTKRSDLLRLREIAGKLVEVMDDEDYDFLTLDQKLLCVMRPEKYPIYRRKITKRGTRVHGMWWMDESQWMRFAWQGHNAKIIKTDLDPDRVLCTRTFEDSWCYIRDMGTHYDLEAMSKIHKWDPVKKKALGFAYEWLTVSVTTEEYNKLLEGGHLGPLDCGCKHHKDDDERLEN